MIERLKARNKRVPAPRPSPYPFPAPPTYFLAVCTIHMQRRQIGDDLVTHPFDGDGMVAAISFSEEGAYYRNRFVSGG